MRVNTLEAAGITTQLPAKPNLKDMNGEIG
jgi:hypothetical protein